MMEPWIRTIREAAGNAPLMVPSAAVWIENEDGHVLLQRRSHAADSWGFPGGNMGWGESAEEAAIREAREETGLDVAIRGLIGVYSKYVRTLVNGHQCQSVSMFFRAEVVSGELSADGIETLELKYFDPHATPRLFISQHEHMLEDARSGRTGVYR